MAWFSNNFPSVAKLFGGLKRTAKGRPASKKGRNRPRATEINLPGIAEPPEDTQSVALEDLALEQVAVVQSAVDLPELAGATVGEAKVEIGERSVEASLAAEPLVAEPSVAQPPMPPTPQPASPGLGSWLLANRKKAETMRSEAQDALEDADGAWQEAEL